MSVAAPPDSATVDAVPPPNSSEMLSDAREMAQQHRRRQHGGVTDAIDREHAKRVAHRCGTLMEEGDQQRRAEANEFPPDEEHRHIAGQRDQLHAR